MKNLYRYNPTPLEKFTRGDLPLHDGQLVRLAKAPAGGKGLPKQFAWIETYEGLLPGRFIGMVLRNTLERV